MRVRVYHAGYGCDSGCCGHVVEVGDDGSRYTFEFIHPYGEEPLAFARQLAERVIAKKWPECLATIDWDSMEVEATDEC